MEGRRDLLYNHFSLYCLNPSERLEMLIIAVIFDGKNYDCWGSAIRTTLKEKKKLGIIDGTLARPAEKENEEFLETNAWDMLNYMLLYLDS